MTIESSRNWPRRWSLHVGGTALAAAALIATTNAVPVSASQLTPDASGPTITLMASVAGNDTTPFWKKLVAPFEKQTGITVNINGYVGPTGSNADEELAQALASGAPPDVFWGGDFNSSIEPALAPYTEKWATKTVLAKQLSVNGTIYVVDLGVQPLGQIFYNKTEFKKAGITTLPKTLAQFTTAMAKLKKAGFLPFLEGQAFVAPGGLESMANPAVFGKDPNWYQLRNSNKVQYQTSAYLTYLDYWYEWLGDGYMNKDAQGLSYNQGNADFLKGDGAMYWMGSWMVPIIDAAHEDANFGVMATPTLNSGQYAGNELVNAANSYFVLKSTKYLAASQELVHWLVTNKAAATAQLRNDGNFEAGFPYKLSSVGQGVQALVSHATNYVSSIEGWGTETEPSGFDTEFYAEINSLWTGGTPQRILKALDSWYNNHE